MKPYYETELGKLYWGDCLDFFEQLQEGSIDLVLTDPPYIHKHIDGGGLARKASFYRERRLENLSNFNFEKYIPPLASLTKFIIAFHSRDLIGDYVALARKLRWKYDLHVWYKTNAIPFTNHIWKSDIEYISLLWLKKPGWTQLSQDYYSKIYVSPLEINRLHPTQKPLNLITKYLKVLNPQYVFDPFLGSGTTAVACERLGRRWIGTEVEERYCQIAAKRIEAEREQLKLF